MPSVDLFTTRFGGPTNWAYALAKAAQTTQYDVRVHHRAARTILSPLWTSADLVHTVLPVPWHLWKKPMLLTVKGDYTRERNLWRSLYPEAIAKADRLTVPSSFLQKILGLPRAVIIPNAIDANDFRTTIPQDRGQLEFLTVTKFWFEGKAEGVVHLAENLKTAMASIHRPYHLTVLGEGPYLSGIRARVNSLGVPVTFTGAASPRDHLSRADVFVYYSLHDNMPNAILEAMASGLPIVSNDVGAVPEMLTDGSDGYVAKDNDTYVKALRVLAEDVVLRTRIGNAARARVVSDFSWQKVIGQYIDIYREMLNVYYA